MKLEIEMNHGDKVVVIVVTVVLAVVHLLSKYGEIVLGWFEWVK